MTARAWRWPWRIRPATRSSRVGALDRVLAGGVDLGDAHHVGVVEAGAEILEERRAGGNSGAAGGRR